MTLDLTDISSAALIAICGMAIATYLTRATGFWLMGYVAITPGIERFLRHMAGGVLVSIVVAAAVKGDVTTWIGLGITVAIMLLAKRPLTAILIGVVAAVLLRQFWP